jgi:hypothetical protein
MYALPYYTHVYNRQFERGDFATDLLQDPAGLSTTGEGAGGKR